MKTIAFFNNRSGAGNTTLVFHLAHAFSRLGYSVLAVDIDPQPNLTAAIFDEEALESIWDASACGKTILQCARPVLDGTGEIAEPEPVGIADGLWVLCGDPGLSTFEERLAECWPRGFADSPVSSLRSASAFHRIVQDTGSKVNAEVALIDVGPNLGAINRAALLAADYLLTPLAADIFSLQALKHLGPAVRRWGLDWKRALQLTRTEFDLPTGLGSPAGYIVLQHTVRLDRPGRRHDNWLHQISNVYAHAVLGDSTQAGQNHCIATLPNYRSLMPMAQEARKPMFDLKAADGAIGSHSQLVQACWKDFANLCRQIATACDIQQQS